MPFARKKNCRLKSVRFVRDGTLKLLLLLSRGEVVLEFELNTVDPLHNGHPWTEESGRCGEVAVKGR